MEHMENKIREGKTKDEEAHHSKQGDEAQSNIDLFHQARRNINGLLQTMSQMPGMMSKMPALPEVDENLASYVLSGLTMAQVLGSGHLKEEPRGW